MLTLGELLELRATDPRYAEREFVLFEDESYTWRETWERSVRYANASGQAEGS